MTPTQNVFSSQYSKWTKQITRNRILKTELKVQKVENAIVLPVKKVRDIPGYDGIFGGGWYQMITNSLLATVVKGMTLTLIIQ